jgi:hypothetical protein
MPHTGRQINVKQALALCHHVGFRGEGLTTMVAVMSRESARYVGAYHMNTTDEGVVWSVDRGLFQLNTVQAISDENAFRCIPSAQAAWAISQHGSYFGRWMAYTGGAYLEAMDYTEQVRVGKRDEWMAIDVPTRLPKFDAPVPPDVVAWRAVQ